MKTLRDIQDELFQLMDKPKFTLVVVLPHGVDPDSQIRVVENKFYQPRRTVSQDTLMQERCKETAEGLLANHIVIADVVARKDDAVLEIRLHPLLRIRAFGSMDNWLYALTNYIVQTYTSDLSYNPTDKELIRDYGLINGEETEVMLYRGFPLHTDPGLYLLGPQLADAELTALLETVVTPGWWLHRINGGAVRGVSLKRFTEVAKKRGYANFVEHDFKTRMTVTQ